MIPSSFASTSFNISNGAFTVSGGTLSNVSVYVFSLLSQAVYGSTVFTVKDSSNNVVGTLNSLSLGGCSFYGGGDYPYICYPASSSSGSFSLPAGNYTISGNNTCTSGCNASPEQFAISGTIVAGAAPGSGSGMSTSTITTMLGSAVASGWAYILALFDKTLMAVLGFIAVGGIFSLIVGGIGRLFRHK